MCEQEGTRVHSFDALEWQGFDEIAKSLSQMQLGFMKEVG